MEKFSLFPNSSTSATGFAPGDNIKNMGVLSVLSC